MKEEMRKEFEEMCSSHFYLGSLGLETNNEGHYLDPDVAVAWYVFMCAWKASREHLVIELPYESWTDYQDNGHYDYGYNTCREDVMEALEQQWSKVEMNKETNCGNVH